jgi:predicted short-subunit dehydrogenase-like oxidoreductase (DUF2520 family)
VNHSGLALLDVEVEGRWGVTAEQLNQAVVEDCRAIHERSRAPVQFRLPEAIAANPDLPRRFFQAQAREAAVFFRGGWRRNRGV